ncbi:neurogenic locus notch homolog protein 1-like isoform X3 [Dreissena polymorpha]|uniref:neurogenic locus notch homolog protein 1-like isoform X3 n=1 Tax=Dreissena polymorpha TaxID=45954 RepID=UPI002264CF6C|nr:neurogenic locus notch homolog protein 1-like isoform X3 [Dreissena polymorpha]
MRLSLKEIKIQAMWITVVFVLTICIQIPSTSTLSDKDDFDYNGFNDYGNCHDHCAACNDSTCTLCKEGWHGVAEEVSGEVAFICDQPCPTPCKSGHCDGKTGYCKDGCKHGYYGKRCEGNCKQICVYGECDSFGNCTIGCEAGTFGPRCDATCPQRCKDALCDVLNGSCSKGCAGNLYGSHCNMTCPNNCNTIAVGPSCQAESGMCLAGCLNGFYGQRCSDMCQHCVNNTCQKDNGVCVHGCILGYRLDVAARKCVYDINECATIPCKNGARCIDGINAYSCKCVAGWTGTNCDQNINECATIPCKNGATCIDRMNAYSCKCVAGWTGTNCSQNINECATIPCKNGATCIDGMNAYSCKCVAGWTGTNCDQNKDVNGYNDNGNCHDHCAACNGSTCKLCKEGWYGEAEEVSGEVAFICDQPCPTPCKSGYCDGKTGYCKDGCKHGHYGKRCEDNCKQICVSGECDLFGNCTIGCLAGTFGPRCVSSCPPRCKDKLCDVLNGSCYKGCAGNFYGSHCNMTCPHTCNTVAVGSTCHTESGMCFSGCLNGFYGQKCSAVCQHCVNNTCQKDDGVCVHGCIIGYKLDVATQKCVYGSHDNDGDPMTQTPESISKPLTVVAIAVGAIAVGCVVIVVVVIRVIVHRKRRRTESRSIETPMKEMDNAIYETCEEPYPVPKAKTYKRSTDWRGQGKHNASQLETLAADQPGFISPNAEVFRGDDGYEVHFPSTSGRNAVDENDANIYSEPDERCFGPKDYIE